ncbi:hypothetical protein ASG54_05210 [Aureimonas sp. Leaf460]|nr:hypothetical protein ASG54_05210 [Aureimonas sp. Leaf460]
MSRKTFNGPVMPREETKSAAKRPRSALASVPPIRSVLVLSASAVSSFDRVSTRSTVSSFRTAISADRAAILPSIAIIERLAASFWAEAVALSALAATPAAFVATFEIRRKSALIVSIRSARSGRRRAASSI